MRVIEGYKLYKTNYIAYDMVNEGGRFSDRYSAGEAAAFTDYMEHQLSTVEPELDRDELRGIFLGIYVNPIVSKDTIASGGTLQ